MDCHDDHGDIAKLIAGRHSKSTEAVELETLPHKGDRVENLDIAKSMIQRTETAAAKGENVVFSLSIQSAEQEDVAGSDDRTGCTIQECKDARRGQELLYRTFLQAFEAELELNPSVGEHAIIVIAAGNAGVDLDKEIEQLQYDYPMAAYNMVIVGGTDAPGSIEMTQNHKADNTWPDMVYSLGVGVNVTSGSKTASCTGTSFATPEVSGILDYIWSQAPSLNASQVMSAFQLTMMIMAENNTLPQDAAGHTDQAFLDEAVKNAKDMLPTPFIPGGNVTNGTSKNESGGWDLGVPDPLPDATATEPYLREVNIEGGTPPYTFSLDSSADFYGTGITMSYENGTISGTPPYTAAGTYHLTICVRDSSGEQEHCANTTLTINPPKYETWSGHVKTSRYECEDIIHGGWSGRIDGEFEFTITVQGDLYRVLNGELSEDIINPWWGLDQSGTWSGTDTVGMACGKSDYRVVGGSVNIPIEVKANNNQSTISGYPVIMFEGKGAMDMDDEPALLPGGWQDIDGSGGIGGTWSSLNFVVLVMSDGFMSGNVSLNENDMGTFTMAKGFGK